MPNAEELVQVMRADIDSLPHGAVQLAAALVAVHPTLPSSLSKWIIHEMGKRVDVSSVSPVAEAVMRIYIFAEKFDISDGSIEIESNYALVRALRMEKELDIAIRYVQELSNRLLEAVGG